MRPSTEVCDNAPAADVSVPTGATCLNGSGTCNGAGQAHRVTVTYPCSDGYSSGGASNTITCNGGAINKWEGSPVCKGIVGAEKGTENMCTYGIYASVYSIQVG